MSSLPRLTRLLLVLLALVPVCAQPVLLDVTDRLPSTDSATGAGAHDERFASLYAPLLSLYRVRAQQGAARGSDDGALPPLRVLVLGPGTRDAAMKWIAFLGRTGAAKVFAIGAADDADDHDENAIGASPAARLRASDRTEPNLDAAHVGAGAAAAASLVLSSDDALGARFDIVVHTGDSHGHGGIGGVLVEIEQLGK